MPSVGGKDTQFCKVPNISDVGIYCLMCVKTVENNDKYEEFKGVRFYFLKENGIHALFVSLG